jgi:hypothetical protein
MFVTRVVVLFCMVSSAHAQSVAPVAPGSIAEPELVRRLSRSEEIRLARSAAPPAVSADAGVMVLEGDRFVEAERGASGVTCLVARSEPKSLEPICYDPEASRTWLPIDIQSTEQRLAGRTRAEIKADVAEGLRTGRFRLPSRPALAYMLSAAQDLYDEEGKQAGAWHPHLMIWTPHLTAQDLGLPTGGSVRHVMVFESGTPMAQIVIPVPNAVTP